MGQKLRVTLASGTFDQGSQALGDELSLFVQKLGTVGRCTVEGSKLHFSKSQEQEIEVTICS